MREKQSAVGRRIIARRTLKRLVTNQGLEFTGLREKKTYLFGIHVVHLLVNVDVRLPFTGCWTIATVIDALLSVSVVHDAEGNLAALVSVTLTRLIAHVADFVRRLISDVGNLGVVSIVVMHFEVLVEKVLM